MAKRDPNSDQPAAPSSGPDDFGSEFLSPREFLRRRRPGYFSDTVGRSQPLLDRAVLDHHLETLTSRDEHGLFETFARKLAQKEISPNLLPHTGPSGGGDSGVDSETYPVSERLSYAWYSGEGRDSAQERWAFAFSAKKEWRSKLRSDVKKIAQRGRDYAKAIFVTSRYVPDRNRATVEDSLRAEFGLDVRVLDRSWLLERVFEGHHEALAVETLRVPVTLREVPITGPLDTERSHRLAELEGRISAAVEAGQLGWSLVQDAIESSVISRELEEPRAGVQGRFRRARDLAEKFGSRHQQVEAVYQEAWTAYWYFEDFARFAELVEEVEERALGSSEFGHIQRVGNLYFCAQTALVAGWVTSDWLEQRRALLEPELDRFSSMRDRPSASLSAETLRLHLTLLHEPDRANDVFGAMVPLVERARGLVGYSFESLAEILSEMGTLVSDSAAFDSLLTVIVDEVASREGDVAAAEMLVRRASQLFDAGFYTDAITKAGRALPLLYKEESRDELIGALGLIGEAYARIGLRWAARGSFLLAANVATSDAEMARASRAYLQLAFDRLRLIEFELGRLGRSFEYHMAYLAVSALDETAAPNDEEIVDVSFDVIVGRAILNLDSVQVSRLRQIPDVLERLQLPLAAAAALFALGHDGEIPRIFEGVGSSPSTDDFRRWKTIEVEGLRQRDLNLGSRDAPIETSILGVKVVIAFDDGSPFVEVAESIAAALESLLATGYQAGIYPIEPTAFIHVRHGHFATWPFDWKHSPDVEATWDVSCREFDPTSLSADEQGGFKNRVRELIGSVLTQNYFLSDAEGSLGRLLGDERALDRSLNFTGSLVVAGNVLGKAPRRSYSQWLTGSERSFEPRPPHKGSTTPATPDRRTDATAVSKPDSPPQVPGVHRTRHDDIELKSVVRLRAWDAAKWIGIGYAVYDDSDPFLTLLFRNLEAARQIAKHWLIDIGPEDLEDQIHLSLIRGIDATQPAHYRFVVGSRRPSRRTTTASIQLSLARIHQMTPESDINLQKFLGAYEARRAFMLGIAAMPGGTMNLENVTPIAAIRKTSLTVREAWQVADGEFEAVAIHADDNPVIPAIVKDPPVAPLLAKLRKPT